MIHRFEELRARFTPEQRARLDSEVSEMNREYVLSQIRDEVAPADDMRIGTLRQIITSLGGKLSFCVNLDGRDYLLQNPV